MFIVAPFDKIPGFRGRDLHRFIEPAIFPRVKSGRGWTRGPKGILTMGRALDPIILAAAAALLDGEAFRLWAFMLATADEHGHWTKPQRALVDALPRYVAGSREPSPTTLRNVQRHIASLRAAGALRVVEDSGNGPVTFAVTVPTDLSKRTGERTAAAPVRPAQAGEKRRGQPSPVVVCTSDNRRYVKSDVYDGFDTTGPSTPPRFSSPLSAEKKPPASSVFSSREDEPAGGRADALSAEELAKRMQAIGEWGLRDADFARRLALTHDEPTIRRAWKLAGEAKNTRDRAGLAAKWLRNGSASASLRREAAKKANAPAREERQAAALNTAAARLAEHEAARAELEADRAVVRRAIEERPEWVREALAAAMDRKRFPHTMRADWKKHALSSVFASALALEARAVESGAQRVVNEPETASGEPDNA